MALEIFGNDDTCIKVYNPTEPDVSKKLIGIFENYQVAGNKLGVTSSTVVKVCQRKSKVFAPRFNMKVVCRLAAKDKEKIKFTSPTTT